VKHWVTYPLVNHPANTELMSHAAIRAFAETAEAAGFDGIGFTDHPAPTDRWLQAGGHDALDPFAVLAYVAAITERLRLIPNICVLPYRNPFVVAKAVATIAMLSNDRFILAAGTGYLRGEYRALGVDPDERNGRFDEALAVLQGVWTTDDFAFDGEYFHAVGQTANPKPAKRVPIWIGGNSAQARQRVATVGDGWNPFAAPRVVAKTARTPPLESADDLAALLDDLWRRVDEAGRDRATIDIAFTTNEGGDPAGDHFDSAAHLEGLERLASIGVTWASAGVPGDSLAHALETLERYGREVIAVERRG
jgi:probable F420-dependent oxidoreductase